MHLDDSEELLASREFEIEAREYLSDDAHSTVSTSPLSANNTRGICDKVNLRFVYIRVDFRVATADFGLDSIHANIVQEMDPSLSYNDSEHIESVREPFSSFSAPS